MLFGRPLVICCDASDALGLEGKWCDVKTGTGNKGKVYGRAEIECSPAVYCHGFQGASKADVQECLIEVTRLGVEGKQCDGRS